MITLDLDDIQGYIIRGYAHMQYSRFVLLQIQDAEEARTWLNGIAESITPATHIPSKHNLPANNLNIAFTSPGLSKLGMVKENVQTFNPEFVSGMVTDHRRRILGDINSNAPEGWNWGGPENDTIHMMLMVFGKTKEGCLDYYESLKNVYLANGIKEIIPLDGQTLSKNREHFGFRDGISQPVIKGSGRIAPEDDMIKAGEFILGYRNEYNVFPDSPLIAIEQGNMNLLPADGEGSGKKDLGRNSSYLVLRQMEQDVKSFWTFMNDNTKNEDGSVNRDESIKLAAKMMGRWPGGAPVTKFPDKDPGGDNHDNDFGYAVHDKEGLNCPLGSHLRRCNPRDSLEDERKKESVKLTKKHRIMRRARLYGEPYMGSPSDTTPNGEVGLLFNCFNADISRQFELIQYTWANSGKVKNLYNDPDPIIGVREFPHDDLPQNFTIQACPVNKTIPLNKTFDQDKKIKGSQFVTIKGGAYYFFPSITAIRYLASL